MALRAGNSGADDRQAEPTPVECGRCGSTASVVKFSPQHTPVQWTAATVPRCAEFRANAAVAAGTLAVSPPRYE